MVQVGDRVKHFTTGHMGVVDSILGDVCLIVFGSRSVGDFQMYRQSRIGYYGDPNVWLHLIDATGKLIAKV